jgi:hypothetical protein
MLHVFGFIDFLELTLELQLPSKISCKMGNINIYYSCYRVGFDS